MIAVATQPGQLSVEASRLRQYLRWATLPNFFAAAALFAIYYFAHARPALIMGVLVALNAVLMEVARRVAARDRVDTAVLWQASGMWLVALAMVNHGIPFFPPAVMCAVLPRPVRLARRARPHERDRHRRGRRRRRDRHLGCLAARARAARSGPGHSAHWAPKWRNLPYQTLVPPPFSRTQRPSPEPYSPDRRTLFVLTAVTWRPEEACAHPTGRIEVVEVNVPGAGLP